MSGRPGLAARAFAAGMIAAALLAAAAPPAAAQQGWSRYKIGRIADVWAERQGELETFLRPGSPEYALSGRDFATKARVTYTGRSRPLTSPAGRVIALWLRAFGGDVNDAALFQSELLFREDGTDFWLPVQDPLVPHFAEEVRPGDAVTLYVIYIGALRHDGRLLGVFLVNEFETAPEP